MKSYSWFWTRLTWIVPVPWTINLQQAQEGVEERQPWCEWMGYKPHYIASGRHLPVARSKSLLCNNVHGSTFQMLLPCFLNHRVSGTDSCLNTCDQGVTEIMENGPVVFSVPHKWQCIWNLDFKYSILLFYKVPFYSKTTCWFLVWKYIHHIPEK